MTTASDTPAANWKNVNNWHWMEKDCTAWAHERIKCILGGLPITDTLSISKVTEVEGEVSTNVRKGKIRQIFDLTISLTLQVAEGKEATVRIVDYMSDTDEKGFEFDFNGLDRSLREPLKVACWNALLSFRKELEDVHGKSLLVNAPESTGTPSAACSDDAASANRNETAKSKFNGVFDDKADNTPSGTASKIEETLEIGAPCEMVFSALTEAEKIRAWSRGTAQVNSVEPGASMSLLNGNIICTIGKVERDHSSNIFKLTMDWKLKQWQMSQVTAVEIVVKPASKANASRIVFKQTGVPAAEVDSVKENWHRYYWEPIRTLLGCPSYSIF